MKEVKIDDDLGQVLYERTRVTRRNKAVLSVGAARVPLVVHVVWRKGASWDSVNKVWNEGTVIGDYTILVAKRIPDAVLDDIRTRGGAL